MSKGIQYTAPPQSEKMKEALRIYIIRERQRKQKERDAEIAEQRRKKLIEQEKQQIRELMEETKERITELDMDVVRLKKEKQDLFAQLTEVLYKENIRKQQIKETNVTGPNTVNSMPINSSIDSGVIVQPQLYMGLPTTTSYQQCNVAFAATPPKTSANQKVVKRSRNPLTLLKPQPQVVSTYNPDYGYKPSTTTVASYPTTTVASYPTTTVASYPTTTVASYPTTTVASYPTTTVASYPTTSVASYPTTSVANYPTTTVASYTPITPIPITPVTPVSIIPVTSSRIFTDSAKGFRKFTGTRKFLRKRSSRKLSGINYYYGPTTPAAQYDFQPLTQSQPVLILPEPNKSIIYSANTPQLANIRQTTPNHIPVSGGVIPIHPLSQVTETGSITLGYPLSRTIQTPQVPYQPPAPYVTISDASGQLLYSMLSQPHSQKPE